MYRRNVQPLITLSYEENGQMDGRVTCNFTSFSTVFQSYHFSQDDVRVIMKGYLQWSLVYNQKNLASKSQIQDHWISRRMLNPLTRATGVPKMVLEHVATMRHLSEHCIMCNALHVFYAWVIGHAW